MKKTKTLFAACMLMLFLAFLPQKTFAAESISTTEVADITDIQDIPATTYHVPTGGYEKVVAFTLKKPAYVHILAHSTVMYERWDNLGDISNFAVYTNENLSNMVTGDYNDNVEGDSDSNKRFCLDAGTYYIYFSKEKGDTYNERSSGDFRLSIAVQSLNLTASKNGSWNKAKAISTNQKQTAFLSTATRTSWLKFNLKAPATVQVRASIGNPWGDSIFNISQTGLTVYKQNHDILGHTNIPDSYYSAGQTTSLNLSAGTYYIAVTGDAYYGVGTNMYKAWNVGDLSVYVSAISNTSITKLSNPSAQKAVLSYKAVKEAKGYLIQYSTDKTFKKDVKTLRKNAKTTSVTLTNLKKNKTYYVRVRAYTKNADGKNLYSRWCHTKKITIKK